MTLSLSLSLSLTLALTLALALTLTLALTLDPNPSPNPTPSPSPTPSPGPGDAGSTFYVVKSGIVKVFMTGAEGEEVVIKHRMGPGEYFGERALVSAEI